MFRVSLGIPKIPAPYEKIMTQRNKKRHFQVSFIDSFVRDGLPCRTGIQHLCSHFIFLSVKHVLDNEALKLGG